ncbi:MAG: hypothetical protein Q7R47_04105, partial [Candidatus Diapherotrites archaeon]|nr:hypothetical protein [Candidatus Diapherotrites archaeon]
GLALCKMNPNGEREAVFQARFQADVGRKIFSPSEHRVLERVPGFENLAHEPVLWIGAVIGARNASRAAHDVADTVGEQWGNFLVRQLVMHAKKKGISHVALQRPEYNTNIFKNPLLQEPFLSGLWDPDKRQALFRLYDGIAQATGFQFVPWSKNYWLMGPLLPPKQARSKAPR